MRQAIIWMNVKLAAYLRQLALMIWTYEFKQNMWME